MPVPPSFGGATQPAVLLLHGSADSPSCWNAVAARLYERFDVCAPQLPPLPSAAGLALDADLPWLSEQMASSGARILAGHSYGALLALRWALAHPGRLDRLVLAEPIAWGVARGLPGTMAKLDELGQHCLSRFEAGDPDAAMQWLVDYWNGAGFWSRLPERIRVSLRAGAVRTWAEVASGGADRTDTDELSQLTVTTRLLAGADSTAESLTVSRAIAAALPAGAFVLVPGAGHQFLRSHAAVVADCVDERR